MTKYFIIAKDDCPTCKGRRYIDDGEGGDYGCETCNTTGKVRREENARRWLADELFKLLMPANDDDPNETVADIFLRVRNMLERELP